MTGLEDFVSIGVVGAALSLLIDLIKQKFGTVGSATKVLTLVLAVIVGGAYTLLEGTPYFTSILGILGASSTIYAMFLK